MTLDTQKHNSLAIFLTYSYTTYLSRAILRLVPKEGLVVFYIALLVLILLGILAVIVVAQNFGPLFSTNVHLTVFSWHSPGIPVLLLCVLGVFLGALVLYVFAAHSARRDKQEMKVLRACVEDLERMSAKAPSGALSTNFAPSVVPIPGFAPGGPGGSGPAGPLNPPGPGPVGPLGQRQPPTSPVQNISPSASGNNLSLPPRLFQVPPQQQQQQQMGAPRPPFQHGS